MSCPHTSGNCLFSGLNFWVRIASCLSLKQRLVHCDDIHKGESAHLVGGPSGRPFPGKRPWLRAQIHRLAPHQEKALTSQHHKTDMAAAPENLPDLYAAHEPHSESLPHGMSASVTSEVLSRSSVSDTPRPSPEGIECYGNQREFLQDMGRFYDNPHFSDVSILVGNRTFCAHKMILIRASEVFERMFSSSWSNESQGLVELVEESECESVFPAFLRFMYTCQISLTINSTLPVLILADKYNIEDLQKVCINFACSYVMPRLQLKDVFHIWFQYATKSCHHLLSQSTVCTLAEKMDDIMTSEEWEVEWEGLDIDQLTEIIGSSELVVQDELTVWNSVVKWLTSAQHPSRAEKMEQNLRTVITFVRFPMMSPDQLCEIEKSKLAESYSEALSPQITQAFKFNSLSLSSRSNMSEFTSSQFLLRSYTDLRWDKRLVIPHFSSCMRSSEVYLKFQTRSSSFPLQSWEWELKVNPRGFTTAPDDFRCLLYSNILMEQSRAVEYSLSIVDNKEVICTVTGKKGFSKSRYTTDTEIDKKVSVSDLSMDYSPYLVNDNLIMQIHLKPLD